MRTLPPRLYIISPSLGVQNHGSLRERARFSLSLHSSLPSLPLASHTHMQNKSVVPLSPSAAFLNNAQHTAGLIYQGDPDMFMFTAQEMLQIDPRTINSHLQISHLVKETKRAPCSPTEPYTAA